MHVAVHRRIYTAFCTINKEIDSAGLCQECSRLFDEAHFESERCLRTRADCFDERTHVCECPLSCIDEKVRMFFAHLQITGLQTLESCGINGLPCRCAIGERLEAGSGRARVRLRFQPLLQETGG